MPDKKEKNMSDWGKANNSPLNIHKSVIKDLHLPKRVLLHDTTLRDGEQFPGVEFTVADKVAIGKALSNYGVHRIEIMPAVSKDDFEATKELISLGLPSEIVGFCRSVENDVDKAVEAGCKSIIMEIIACPAVLKGVGWSFNEATEKFIKMSHYAKSKGLRVGAFFVAITDAPIEFSEKFIKKILKDANIDSIGIPDTFSKCLPNAIYHFVRDLKKWTDLPVEIHSHNAYNMGVANAISGVMAGAEVVHTCVNSLGEGAGNAALDAVAINLKMMLGIDTGIKFEQTYELSQLVSKLARVPIQANWPLVGDRVFTTESGILVDIITKMVKAGSALPPEHDIATIVGRKRNIVVGKLSGSTSIKVKMKQLGLPEEERETINQILSKVKEQSTKKHDSLTDEEFKHLVSEIV